MMSEEVKNGRYEDKYGTVRWYQDGELHREDGPAVEMKVSGKTWKKMYFKDGMKHRLDGPAVEQSDGKNDWYKDGVLHREDGPACETALGYKSWYLDGDRHREDGPAVEWPDGRKEWWVNGVNFTEEEFNHWLSKKQLNERLTEQLKVKPTGKKVKI